MDALRVVQSPPRGAVPSMASRARVLALRLARDKWCVSRAFSRALLLDPAPSPTAVSCPTRARRAPPSRGRSRAALAAHGKARRDRRDSTRFTPLTVSRRHGAVPRRVVVPNPRHAQGFPRIRGRRAVSRARGGGRGGPGEKQRGPRAFPATLRRRRRAARGGVLRRAVPFVGGEPRRVVAPRSTPGRVARARSHPPGRPGARGVAAGVLERRAGVPRVRPPRRGAPRAARAPHRSSARREDALQTKRLRRRTSHVPDDVHAALQPAHVLVRVARLRAEERREKRRRRAARRGKGGVRRSAPPPRRRESGGSHGNGDYATYAVDGRRAVGRGGRAVRASRERRGFERGRKPESRFRRFSRRITKTRNRRRRLGAKTFVFVFVLSRGSRRGPGGPAAGARVRALRRARRERGRAARGRGVGVGEGDGDRRNHEARMAVPKGAQGATSLVVYDTDANVF